MINTSDRIKNIVDVIEYDTLVDVGTDHGFIAILSVQKGKTKKVLACDLNKGPLQRCNENIEKYGLNEQIRTKISNGIEEVEVEHDCVTICGMGGLLVHNILDKDREKTKKFKQLVLQPQSDYYMVRKLVYEMGFYIKNEVYFIDNLKQNSQDKYYMIFNCVKGEKEMPCEKELMYGKNIDENSKETYTGFIEMCLDKGQKAYKSLTENSKSDVSIKKEYYEKVIKYCEEILNEIK